MAKKIKFAKKQLKQEEFEKIKGLQGVITPKEATQIFKRSYTVIGTINKAKDYKDYQRLTRERYLNSSRYLAAQKLPLIENDVPVPTVPTVTADQVKRLDASEQVTIKQITSGFAVGKQRVIGLGEDNSCYTWVNQKWEIL